MSALAQPRSGSLDRLHLLDARRVAGTLLAALALAAALGAALTRAPLDAPPPTPIARRIDLNAATAEQLALLPNIGPARAAAIIADRAKHGPFLSLDDLDRVPGIGPRTIADLAPFANPGR